MSEARRIEDQLRRAFEGEAWHGPSLREVLSGVTAEQAAARPLARGHSIWEIVCHVAAWERTALRRVKGEAVRVSDAEDWPAEGSGQAAWQDSLAELERGNVALRAAIGALEDAALEAIAPGERYSIYFLLHGVIQHALYHAGQIALLKKA